MFLEVFWVNVVLIVDFEMSWKLDCFKRRIVGIIFFRVSFGEVFVLFKNGFGFEVFF